MMRQINWIKWKESPTLHLYRNPYDKVQIVRELDYRAYDKDARIVKIVDPNDPLPLIFTAQLNFDRMHIIPFNGTIGFNLDHYAWVLGERLSSTDFHNKIFNQHLWLTIADRDYLFEQLMG